MSKGRSMSQLQVRLNSPFSYLFTLLGPQLIRCCLLHWGWIFLTQSSDFKWQSILETPTDIPRNNALLAIYVSLRPARLTPQLNHHGRVSFILQSSKTHFLTILSVSQLLPKKLYKLLPCYYCYYVFFFLRQWKHPYNSAHLEDTYFSSSVKCPDHRTQCRCLPDWMWSLHPEQCCLLGSPLITDYTRELLNFFNLWG